MTRPAATGRDVLADAAARVAPSLSAATRPVRAALSAAALVREFVVPDVDR